MSFSDCGRSLVIQRHGFPHPSIKSIEKCLCFKRRQNKGKSDRKSRSERSIVHSTVRVGEVLAYDTGTLRSGQIQHFAGPHGSQHTQHLQVTVSGVAGIGLVQSHSGHNGDVTSLQPMVALPSTAGTHHLHVNMELPQSKEELIKLIVNKSAQPVYSLDDDQDRHFPAMITKNQKALNMASSGKRESEVLSETDQSGKSTKKIKHS